MGCNKLYYDKIRLIYKEKRRVIYKTKTQWLSVYNTVIVLAVITLRSLYI